MSNSDKWLSFQSVIAQNLGVEIEAVALTADLREDLGADSLDAIYLMSAIDQAFNVNISDEQMKQIKTVADLWDFVRVS